MSESNRQNDEELLIDLLLGRCDADQAERLRRRLAEDEAFAALHADLQNTFAALDLAPAHEPPADLVAATMRRIDSARRTDALLAREQLDRTDVIRPTFSWRELGAVAAVALLVCGIVGLSYRQAQHRKQRTLCAAQAARIGSALLTYASRNGGYLPATGTTRRRWLPTGKQPAVSNSKALFRLVAGGYARPGTFQCPAVSNGTFAYRAGMVDFPESRYVGYSYQYSIGPRGVFLEEPDLARVKRSMAILADATPLFPNGRFVPERLRRPVSDNHDCAGMNVLYLDMHVEFRDAPAAGVDGDNIYLAGNLRNYEGEEAPARPTDTFCLPAFTNDGVIIREEAPPEPSDGGR